MERFVATAKTITRVAQEAVKNRQAHVPPAHLTYTITAKPVQTPNSAFKVFFVTFASLYLGGLIAREGASFLEENEIFVPSDDDDDDD